jgi:Domain of unknown function (DUF4326)
MPDPQHLVVNLKDHRDWRPDRLPEDVVYVGRAMYRGGWRLPASPLASPFTISRDASAAERAEALEDYRRWLLNEPELMASLARLRGRRLACWCAPLACHAAVLAELASDDAPHG